MRVDFFTGDFIEGEQQVMAERLRVGPGLSKYESNRRPTGEWTPLDGTLIPAIASPSGPDGEDEEDAAVEGFNLVMIV